MVPKGQFGKGVLGYGVGVCLVAVDAALYLGFHPVNIGLLEAWFAQGQAQKLQRLVRRFRQELCRNRKAVIVGIVSEPGGQTIARSRKGPRIQITCAFFQEACHQVDGPALARRIQRCAPLKANFECDEGDRGLFHKPSRDATGGGHLLNVHFGVQGQRAAQGRKAGGGEGADHHWLTSCGAVGVA